MTLLRDQLRTAALLGANTPLQPEGSPLDDCLPALAQREAPQHTLDAIALVTVYEAAGRLPLPASVPPPPCPQAPIPLCSAMAAGHLSELLKDSRGLMPEWLAIAAETGVRPPGEWVPALLDAATRNRTLRESVALAVGSLGVWLAPFREEWVWVKATASREATPLDEASWETGTLSERLFLLSQLRVTSPSRARQFVERTWGTESADTRRQLLECFATSLSLDDEDFLEACLDDRSVVVRRASAELLSSLSGSRLGQRMSARLTGRIRIHRTGLLRKRTLDLTLIEDLAPALARDCIERKPPTGSKLGERAWWTSQILACLHPSKWVQELDLSPEQLIDAAGNGEWRDLILDAWRVAAVRYQATDWLVALSSSSEPATSATTAIFRSLPLQDRERCMLRLVEKDPEIWAFHVPMLCPHAWSDDFTRAVWKLIHVVLTKLTADQLLYQGKSLLRASALLASPDVVATPQDDFFTDCAGILHYRRHMRQALRSKENR